MDGKDRELRKDGKLAVRAASESPVVPASSVASEARTAELFRHGDDLVARGLYEQAIHVWTRILFIDRGNARAKRAIDKAKRDLSERQRELDVEIADAIRLLDAGEIEAAAEKVRRVLAVDPRHSEAQQLRQEITALRHRQDVGHGSGSTEMNIATDVETDVVASGSSKRGLLLKVSRQAAATPGRSGSRTPNPSPLKMAGFVLGVILVFASGALYLHLNWEAIVSDGAFTAATALAPIAAEPLDAAVPDASELRYYNGARLYAKGRYREALSELSEVARDSAVFESARSLVLRIEERLLRGAEEPSPELGEQAEQAEQASGEDASPGPPQAR